MGLEGALDSAGAEIIRAEGGRHSRRRASSAARDACASLAAADVHTLKRRSRRTATAKSNRGSRSSTTVAPRPRPSRLTSGSPALKRARARRRHSAPRGRARGGATAGARARGKRARQRCRRASGVRQVGRALLRRARCGIAVDVSPRTARTDAPRARAMQFPFRFDGASLRCTANSNFFTLLGARCSTCSIAYVGVSVWPGTEERSHCRCHARALASKLMRAPIECSSALEWIDAELRACASACICQVVLK